MSEPPQKKPKRSTQQASGNLDVSDLFFTDTDGQREQYVRITSNGKMSKKLEFILKQMGSDTFEKIVLYSANPETIPKLISVAEIAKRAHPSAVQTNELYNPACPGSNRDHPQANTSGNVTLYITLSKEKPKDDPVRNEFTQDTTHESSNCVPEPPGVTGDRIRRCANGKVGKFLYHTTISKRSPGP
eukprot:TRINITY_DN67099_c1_g1_i1.p1 TRINITY_DN67099_c1_g1~~TRINITY_DN67099_c1_g1_i1.p1  ORF type:complete len:199 (-),score=14.85 TRINITY_DN67099_c1_g1_i1:130-690(-)